ncbi:MAG: tripartite tricarboxylate transporter substrate binding protein [Burkholderiales bacterium]
MEIVVPSAQGSGSDGNARRLQQILQEMRLVSVPVTVVNKPGAGGAIALAYLNQHAGNGHYLYAASHQILSAHILGTSSVSYTDVTPIVHLYGEYIGTGVKADSHIKSGADLIERMKKDPASLSFGIASTLGSANHQSIAAALKDAGVDPRRTRNVVFNGGALAKTAMLGGHVDVVPLSLGSWVGNLKARDVRVIAVSSPRRMRGVFADIPTWREQGRDVVTSQWRALIGPKGLTPAQVAFWDDVMRRVAETDEWKKEVELIHGSPEFLGSAEFRKLMEADNAQARSLFVSLGLAK